MSSSSSSVPRNNFPVFTAYIAPENKAPQRFGVELMPEGSTEAPNIDALSNAARRVTIVPTSSVPAPTPPQAPSAAGASAAASVPFVPPAISVQWHPTGNQPPLLQGELRFPAIVTPEGLFVQSGTFVTLDGKVSLPALLGAQPTPGPVVTAANVTKDLAVQASKVSALLGVATPMSSLALSVPASKPKGIIVDTIPFNGHFALITRHGTDGNPVNEMWPIADDSWGVRFAPMITNLAENSPGRLALSRLRPQFFDGMSPKDWEAFAQHFDKTPISSPLHLKIKGSETEGLQRDIGSLSYVALLLRACNAENHVSGLLATRPQTIGREIAQFHIKGLVTENILLQSLQKIGERYAFDVTNTYVPDVCAGANVFYNFLSREVGSPKHAHKHGTVAELCAGLKVLGQRLIVAKRDDFLEDQRVARACGIAFGMAVAGALLYVDEQRKHGERRNAYIALPLNVLLGVGMACLGAFTAGAAPAVIGIVATITGTAGATGAGLIEKAVGSAPPFKVYDWAPAMKFFGDEMSAMLKAKLLQIENDTNVWEAVNQFIKGFDNAREWTHDNFTFSEGEPGSKRLRGSKAQQLLDVTGATTSRV